MIFLQLEAFRQQLDVTSSTAAALGITADILEDYDAFAAHIEKIVNGDVGKKSTGTGRIRQPLFGME